MVYSLRSTIFNTLGSNRLTCDCYSKYTVQYPSGEGHHAAAPSRSRHPSQLDGLEGPRGSLTHIQNDANTHWSRRVRRVPAKNSKGGDAHLSSLPTGVSRRPQLLRASNASEGAGGKEERRSRQGGSTKRTDTTTRDRGTTTTAVIE
jgi:hypothetical protein